MRCFLVLLIGLLFIVSCKNKNNLPQAHSIDSAKLQQTKPVKSDSIVTLFSNDQIKISGYSEPGNYTPDIELKFEPYISFADFKVEKIYSGEKSPINYKSNVIARTHKTIITDTYKANNVTFGGHYSFIDWGCGLPCQNSVIVDLIDGKVYDGLSATQGFLLLPASRMIVVNPPDSTGFYDPTCIFCLPEIWIWNEQRKKFIQRKPAQ